jgi:hypothetical protein
MRSMHDARVCGERCHAGLRGCLFVALVILCLAAGTLHARPAAAAGPVIAVDTNVLAGGVQANGVYTPSDSEFWIQVAVMDAAPTGAFEFQLSFDSQIFQYLGWSEGAFLGSSGLDTACVPNISQHTVNIGCNTVSSSGVAGPSGNGTLIIIRFHPKLAAPGCFLLTGVETATTDGAPIPTSSQDGCVTPSTLASPPTATWTAVAPTATWTAAAPPTTATWTPVPTATAMAPAATATSVSVPTSIATTAAGGVAPTATAPPAAGRTSEAAAPQTASGTPASATSARSTPASGGDTGQTGGATGASAHGTGLSADAPAGEVSGAGSAGGSPGQGTTTNAGQSGSGDAGSAVGAGDSSAEHDVLSSTKRPDGSPADVSAASSGAGGGGVAWWIVALAAIGGCVVGGLGAAGGRWWWARRA